MEIQHGKKIHESREASVQVTKHESLLGFVQHCQNSDPCVNDPKTDIRTRNYPLALKVITEGWSEVLGGLNKAEVESRAAFAPVRKNPWGYTGGRVSIDRMLAGKPCISRPVRKMEPSNKFIRLIFVGECMVCEGPTFVERSAKLLNYIRTCASKGVQVELWGAWGGRSASIGAISLVKVKGFSEPINLPVLSGIGHKVLLQTCQFGSERAVNNGNFFGTSFFKTESYKQALAGFIGQKEAESSVVICDADDIDPTGWLKKEGIVA